MSVKKNSKLLDIEVVSCSSVLCERQSLHTAHTHTAQHTNGAAKCLCDIYGTCGNKPENNCEQNDNKRIVGANCCSRWPAGRYTTIKTHTKTPNTNERWMKRQQAIEFGWTQFLILHRWCWTNKPVTRANNNKKVWGRIVSFDDEMPNDFCGRISNVRVEQKHIRAALAPQHDWLSGRAHAIHVPSTASSGLKPNEPNTLERAVPFPIACW